MRIIVDPAKCCGFGACVMTAEDLFDLDVGTNLAVPLVEVVPPEAAARLEAAMQECPTAAISVSTDPAVASG